VPFYPFQVLKNLEIACWVQTEWNFVNAILKFYLNKNYIGASRMYTGGQFTSGEL
jgi:hypothetical protein